MSLSPVSGLRYSPPSSPAMKTSSRASSAPVESDSLQLQQPKQTQDGMPDLLERLENADITKIRDAGSKPASNDGTWLGEVLASESRLSLEHERVVDPVEQIIEHERDIDPVEQIIEQERLNDTVGQILEPSEDKSAVIDTTPPFTIPEPAALRTPHTPRVQFAQEPDRMEEQDHKLGVRKALAYASKLVTTFPSLQELRDIVLKKREYLAHQEASLADKQFYMLQAVKSADATISSSRKFDTSAQSLYRSLAGVRRTMKEVEDQTARVTQLKEELGRRETELQIFEDKIHETIRHFADHAADFEAKDFEAISAPSSISSDDDSSRSYVPPEVEEYLDKVGDHRILMERVMELEAEYAAELAQRALLEDQETPMLDNVARATDVDYNRDREELLNRLRLAEEAVQRAQLVCIEQGFDPEHWYKTTASEDGESNDETGPETLTASRSGIALLYTDSSSQVQRDPLGFLHAVDFIEHKSAPPILIDQPDIIHQWLSGVTMTPSKAPPVAEPEQEPQEVQDLPEAATVAKVLPIELALVSDSLQKSASISSGDDPTNVQVDALDHVIADWTKERNEQATHKAMDSLLQQFEVDEPH